MNSLKKKADPSVLSSLNPVTHDPLKDLLRSFKESLEIGTALACVAGVINSVGLIAFSSFVSHISGHATRAAMEYSAGNKHIAYIFLMEIFFFFMGTLTTTILMGGKTLTYKTVNSSKPIMIEIFIISIIGLSSHYRMINDIPLDKGFTGLALHGLSFAMGLQNALLRQAAGGIIRTTHMTGNVTDMGIALGTAIYYSYKEVGTHFQKSKSEFQLLRIFKMFILAFWERFRAERFLFHFLLLIAFLLGAVVGTFGFFSIDFYVLLIPVGILGLVLYFNG